MMKCGEGKYARRKMMLLSLQGWLTYSQVIKSTANHQTPSLINFSYNNPNQIIDILSLIKVEIDILNMYYKYYIRVDIKQKNEHKYRHRKWVS